MSTLSHDVVVLGTGAPGLVAALVAHDPGADVGLYEKAAEVGGTTVTLRRGIAWVPINHFAHRRRASATPATTPSPTSTRSRPGAIDLAQGRRPGRHGPRDACASLEATTPLRLRDS